MAIKTIFVVGAGFMGAGIAQVGAQAGYEMLLYDISTEAVDKGVNTAKKNLGRNVEKGKLTQEAMDKALSLIKPSTSLNDGAKADLIIEAVFENLDVKNEIFSTLDGICPPSTLFATNTSSIPISTIANSVKRKDKFIGMHFFSPVPVMRLCELINSINTSAETYKAVEEVAQKMGKETVKAKDVPGFIVNRINAALRQECYRCMEEGVATPQDIDKALKAGLNHPMGPFELGDFVGLDIGYNVINTLYNAYKEPKWAPNLTLEKLVKAGDYGRKTGKGWYDYTSGERKPRTDVNF
ncbi:MAG: 3-hydroxyacyl-CoA dehydrogenase family protein [Syntrophomonadaceae bacterium]|jgi:3-hydroxybutyryl-CoA dehydrogenase|nr:3-hydroxyacyl-CoA dehydrogenase family protein [Syntrophomonadaceae bacterium]